MVEIVLSTLFLQIGGVDQRVSKEGYETIYSPFTIPHKDNCDLCKIKTNKRKANENRFLDKLFKMTIETVLISFSTDLGQ